MSASLFKRINQLRPVARETARREAACYLNIIACLDPTLGIEPDLLSRIHDASARYDFEQVARTFQMTSCVVSPSLAPPTRSRNKRLICSTPGCNGWNLAPRTVSARLKVYVCLERSCCPPHARGRLRLGRLSAQNQGLTPGNNVSADALTSGA